MNKSMIFVSWAPYCSRSDSIAARLGGASHLVYSAFWGSNPATILIKYAVQSVRTLRLLWRERPGCVFVMAPPVVACLPVWLYCVATGARFVIDAHTGAFLDKRWRNVIFLQKFFSRRAVTTIVTNEFLKQQVETWNADATIVRDVPVCFAVPERVVLEGDFKITVVNTFARDEPVEEVFKAAARLPEVRFYVTGNAGEADRRLLARKPANVVMTGFVSNARYVGQLQASDAVMVLTTRDHTMQRGAYEAVYLERPVITSNFELLRRAFDKGAVHVDAVADDIVRGIVEMRGNLHHYQKEVVQLRQEKHRQWDSVAKRLAERLSLSNDVLKREQNDTSNVV